MRKLSILYPLGIVLPGRAGRNCLSDKQIHSAKSRYYISCHNYRSAVSHFFLCIIITQSIDRALLKNFIYFWPFLGIIRKSIKTATVTQQALWNEKLGRKTAKVK